jgi:hypothetical protein
MSKDRIGVLPKFACGLFLVVSLTGLSHNADAAAKNIGFVLDVSGQCFLNGAARPLEAGQRLPAGAVLRFPTHYASSDYVNIALRDGTKFAVHCDEPSKCDSPIRLPAASEGNHIMQTILDSLLPQGRQYVVPITRGLRPPRELVLEFAAGEVDVSPLFADEREGVYDLVLDPISTPAAPAASSSITLSVAWGPGHSPKVAAPGLRAGLFEASVPQLQMDQVWVLIAPSADYRRDADDLDDAARLARGWQLGPADLHGFLRTYLASLASQSSGADP